MLPSRVAHVRKQTELGQTTSAATEQLEFEKKEKVLAHRRKVIEDRAKRLNPPSPVEKRLLADRLRSDLDSSRESSEKARLQHQRETLLEEQRLLKADEARALAVAASDLERKRATQKILTGNDEVAAQKRTVEKFKRAQEEAKARSEALHPETTFFGPLGRHGR